jgi:transcriptional regulator with XRE-family HTH domain
MVILSELKMKQVPNPIWVNSFLRNVSNNIRSKREEKEMTQEELSSRSGVFCRYVQKIEQGRNLPKSVNMSMATYFKISCALDCEISELMET